MSTVASRVFVLFALLASACGVAGGEPDPGASSLSGTRCPAIAPPPADFCKPGEKPAQVVGPSGCPNFACVPDEAPRVCPAIAPPPADFCKPGEKPAQVVGPNGCPNFACVPA
jgi:hypothetical protein